MKEVEVCRIGEHRLELGEINERLAGATQYPIDVVNWDTFDYCPPVTFAVGYGGGDLCVRFAVEEDAVLAVNTQPNDPVCQDSCVEMFMAPTGGDYFNFEFNCIGTTLVGRGSGRGDLTYLDPGIIHTVRRYASLGADPFPERKERTCWQLAAAIPLSLIGLNEAELPGHVARANWYKCGDKLSTRHYLTWNPVETPGPDFHRPEYFGSVRFL